MALARARQRLTIVINWQPRRTNECSNIRNTYAARVSDNDNYHNWYDGCSKLVMPGSTSSRRRCTGPESDVSYGAFRESVVARTSNLIGIETVSLF